MTDCLMSMERHLCVFHVTKLMHETGYGVAPPKRYMVEQFGCVSLGSVCHESVDCIVVRLDGIPHVRRNWENVDSVHYDLRRKPKQGRVIVIHAVRASEEMEIMYSKT